MLKLITGIIVNSKETFWTRFNQLKIKIMKKQIMVGVLAASFLLGGVVEAKSDKATKRTNKSAVRACQSANKTVIKGANSTYKTETKRIKAEYKAATKAAKVTLRTALKAATDEAGKVAAREAYKTAIKTAMATKNAALKLQIQTRQQAKVKAGQTLGTCKAAAATTVTE